MFRQRGKDCSRNFIERCSGKMDLISGDTGSRPFVFSGPARAAPLKLAKSSAFGHWNAAAFSVWTLMGSPYGESLPRQKIYRNLLRRVCDSSMAATLWSSDTGMYTPQPDLTVDTAMRLIEKNLSCSVSYSSERKPDDAICNAGCLPDACGRSACRVGI